MCFLNDRSNIIWSRTLAIVWRPLNWTFLSFSLSPSLLSLLGSICTPFSQCLYNDLYSQFAEWWLFIRLHVVVTRCCLCRSKAYFREKQECNWVCDTHTANNLNIDQIRSTFLLFFAFTLWLSFVYFTQNGRNIQYLTISDVTCSKLVTAIDIFTGNWKPNQHFYTKAENIYATECHQVNTHTPNRNGRLSMRMRVCVSVCIVRIS